MTESDAIAAAQAYLKQQGRDQEVVGTVRLDEDKLRKMAEHLATDADRTHTDKTLSKGPSWSVHFKFDRETENAVCDPEVNIVAVYDDGTIEEIDVL